tara:strand:- start:1007 stop:1354 length:348 start_codon:yes stop_codon:yes gene_type:complete
MRIFIFIIFLLFINCASNSNQKSSCQNNGKIDFMYINIPCEKCVDLITEIMDNNEHVFSYDIIRNKDSHILINYCYNYKKIQSKDIEKMMTNNNFAINKSMTQNQEKYLQSICCN